MQFKALKLSWETIGTKHEHVLWIVSETKVNLICAYNLFFNQKLK